MEEIFKNILTKSLSSHLDDIETISSFAYSIIEDANPLKDEMGAKEVLASSLEYVLAVIEDCDISEELGNSVILEFEFDLIWEKWKDLSLMKELEEEKLRLLAIKEKELSSKATVTNQLTSEDDNDINNKNSQIDLEREAIKLATLNLANKSIAIEYSSSSSSNPSNDKDNVIDNRGNVLAMEKKVISKYYNEKQSRIKDSKESRLKNSEALKEKNNHRMNKSKVSSI